jgi:hypothetical protein
MVAGRHRGGDGDAGDRRPACYSHRGAAALRGVHLGQVGPSRGRDRALPGPYRTGHLGKAGHGLLSSVRAIHDGLLGLSQ